MTTKDSPSTVDENSVRDEALDQTARALLEETDTDSRIRTYKGKTGIAITVLLCIWTAFQLWFSTFGVISAVTYPAVAL